MVGQVAQRPGPRGEWCVVGCVPLPLNAVRMFPLMSPLSLIFIRPFVSRRICRIHHPVHRLPIALLSTDCHLPHPLDAWMSLKVRILLKPSLFRFVWPPRTVAPVEFSSVLVSSGKPVTYVMTWSGV